MVEGLPLFMKWGHLTVLFIGLTGSIWTIPGFFRYYSALISTLRSYDISNIDNARVVYKLSDELLNNMYQAFKNDWNKEDFDKLTESQLKWIEKKTKIEEEYKNDDLVRYQTLIEMTLDKCEEWTEYYR